MRVAAQLPDTVQRTRMLFQTEHPSSRLMHFAARNSRDRVRWWPSSNFPKAYSLTGGTHSLHLTCKSNRLQSSVTNIYKRQRLRRRYNSTDDLAHSSRRLPDQQNLTSTCPSILGSLRPWSLSLVQALPTLGSGKPSMLCAN